jgi:hypothetical protein
MTAVFAPLAPLVPVAAAVVLWLRSWVYKYHLMFVFVIRSNRVVCFASLSLSFAHATLLVFSFLTAATGCDVVQCRTSAALLLGRAPNPRAGDEY